MKLHQLKEYFRRPKLIETYVDTSVVVLNKLTGLAAKFMKHLLTIQNIDPNTIPGKKFRDNLSKVFEPQEDKNLEEILSTSFVSRKVKGASGAPPYYEKLPDLNYTKPFAKWNWQTRTWTSCEDPTLTSSNHYDLIKQNQSNIQNLFEDIQVFEAINVPEVVESLMVTKKKPTKKAPTKKKVVSKKVARKSSRGKK